ALRHLGDALAPDAIRSNRGAKRQRRQNGQLVSRVPGFDVVRRVRLRVTQFLGLAQGVSKRRAAFGHARQDIVGRAVDDADHAGDAVGGEVELKWTDQRYATADAGFVGDADATRGRSGQDGWSVLGHHLFVGRNNVLALVDRPQDAGAG